MPQQLSGSGGGSGGQSRDGWCMRGAGRHAKPPRYVRACVRACVHNARPPTATL